MQYVWLWLTQNEQSPYRGSQAMVLAAMDVDKRFWSDLRKGFKKGKLIIRYSVRIRLTAKFKLLLSGAFVPRVERVNKLGVITKYSILPAVTPQPLPIPAWIKGSIRITTKGLQLMVKGTPAIQPSGDRNRLFNPFGVR
jgi:hypothetical protein